MCDNTRRGGSADLLKGLQQELVLHLQVPQLVLQELHSSSAFLQETQVDFVSPSVFIFFF